MEELLARIRQLEFELEGLKTRERGALELLYPTQAVAAAGGAASIRYPAAGSFPTNFKDLLFVGVLRGTKAATSDTLNITVNAVAANYGEELLQASAATAAGIEVLPGAGTAWVTIISAANAPAGILSAFEMRIYDYATSYRTKMKLENDVVLSLLTNNIITRFGHGFINSAQAVTSVTFAFAGGNIAQNSYLSCYGVSG